MSEFMISQSDGTIVQLSDIQKRGLELLDYFIVFCKKYEIDYTLCGGCCIGALRHQGFIPWDDDIDVHMLRKDYERFTDLWKKEKHPENIALVKTTGNEFQDTMLTQIALNDTTFIKSNQTHLDINHGIKLEILPLDGAPDSSFKRKVQLVWALIFYLFNRGFVPENRGPIVARISSAILKVFNTPEKRVKIWKFAEKQMTKYDISKSNYVTELCVTWKYMKIKYPKEIFIGKRIAQFEGRKVRIPKLAEEYLQMAFGNFMELPPIEEQKAKHDTAYIDLNHSFHNYKGKYYL